MACVWRPKDNSVELIFPPLLGVQTLRELNTDDQACTARTSSCGIILPALIFAIKEIYYLCTWMFCQCMCKCTMDIPDA